MTIISGLLCIYKPPRWSSSQCVVKIRRLLEAETKKRGMRKKVKVGHGGTLDPMAEGVLVLGVGSGTKLLEKYLKGYKRYRATGLLGIETDTLDSTGKIIHTSSYDHVTNELINEHIGKNFRGHILQVPPMYSALNHEGKRLYELARAGIEVERAPRKVEVKELFLREENTSLPTFTLEMESSGGFYVRSLIRDLGLACNTHAHMTGLIRLKHGPFSIDDCLYENDWNLERIEQHIEICNRKLDVS